MRIKPKLQCLAVWLLCPLALAQDNKETRFSIVPQLSLAHNQSKFFNSKFGVTYKPELNPESKIKLTSTQARHVTSHNEGIHSPAPTLRNFQLLQIAMGNRSPTSLIFLNPLSLFNPIDGPDLQWRFDVDGSSHSIVQSRRGNALELDGETWRASFKLQKRLHPRWVLLAEIPFVSHSAGLFDSTIDRWHRISGLPDGQRDQQPNDRLFFGYRNDGIDFSLQKNQQRLGDITFATSYQLPSLGKGSQENRSSLQMLVKIPTGEVRAFTGSGKWDSAIGLNHQYAIDFLHRPSTVNLSGAITYLGTSALLTDDQRSWRSDLSVQFGWRWKPTVTPELQLRWQSALANHTVPHLSHSTLAIDVGVQLDRPKGVWKIGFSEDIRVDSSPDVSVYCAYIAR